MLMRDSINAGLIPQDTPVVAGYGDGLYIWSSADWARFPNSTALSIVVNPADAGDILDVERYDASPADVPGWVRRFNRPGRRRPTVYSDRSTWPQIVAALQAAGLSANDVDWWAATLDGTQNVPGAVAVQYVDTGAYDESVILDPSWVGGTPVAAWDGSYPMPDPPPAGTGVDVAYSGVIMPGARWYDGPDGQDMGAAPVGTRVSTSHAAFDGVNWFDRIAPGTWWLLDSHLDGTDAAHPQGQTPVTAWNEAHKPGPAPAPIPTPEVTRAEFDALAARVADLEAKARTHTHPVSVQGTTSLTGQSGPPA